MPRPAAEKRELDRGCINGFVKRAHAVSKQKRESGARTPARRCTRGRGIRAPGSRACQRGGRSRCGKRRGARSRPRRARRGAAAPFTWFLSPPTQASFAEKCKRPVPRRGVRPMGEPGPQRRVFSTSRKCSACAAQPPDTLRCTRACAPPRTARAAADASTAGVQAARQLAVCISAARRVEKSASCNPRARVASCSCNLQPATPARARNAARVARIPARAAARAHAQRPRMSAAPSYEAARGALYCIPPRPPRGLHLPAYTPRRARADAHVRRNAINSRNRHPPFLRPFLAPPAPRFRAPRAPSKQLPGTASARATCASAPAALTAPRRV